MENFLNCVIQARNGKENDMWNDYDCPDCLEVTGALWYYRLIFIYTSMNILLTTSMNAMRSKPPSHVGPPHNFVIVTGTRMPPFTSASESKQRMLKLYNKRCLWPISKYRPPQTHHVVMIVITSFYLLWRPTQARDQQRQTQLKFFFTVHLTLYNSIIIHSQIVVGISVPHSFPSDNTMPCTVVTYLSGPVTFVYPPPIRLRLHFILADTVITVT